MKYRVSAPTVLIVASAAMALGTALVTNRLFDGTIASVEDSRFALMRAILTTSFAETEAKALARADIVGNMRSVRRLVAAQDREGLLAESEGMYKSQHDRFGLDQAQFHVLPATSLLRLDNPAKYGDDLSSFRPMIVEMGKERNPLKGVSISRKGPAVFGVVPVKDEAGEYAGSFEFGLEFGPVFDNIKANYGFDASIFIDEKPLREIATGLGGDVLTESNRVGPFIRFHTTHLDRMKELVTDLDITSGEERRYVRDAFGVPYGVIVMPVTNYAGKPLGMAAIAADFSGSRAAGAQMRVWQGLIALCTTVLSAAVAIVTTRGMVLRPMQMLSGKLAALASGDRSQAIGDDEGLCEEMREFAENYEKLRTGSGDGGK